ncbi:hypothetical protein TSAR_015664 [Trichomalopsis sarcophagae]|uniref:Lipase n=1 Tax=Trichomalopsis sarcophagae TaxID=543379 RepID=A0A232EX80_9HYME|nr:hypothetical protein TSAR_015664 [Trichomalopsis sarcophagae]
MTSLRIFVSAIALLAASVVSSKVAPEALDVLNEELQDLDFPEAFNLTSSDLVLRYEHPHANMNVPEIVAYYEYKVEKHTIRTTDGYILGLHRIAGNKTHPKPDGKPAVFLMHGLLCSSMDWVVAGPERGLGFILADAGYDVWMGNARGNKYSRRHAELTTDDAEYWNFSWHEIGTKDLPVTIDYILKRTGHKKVAYIGHSQGSTAFTVMLSEHPEYNEKITSMYSLAPISYLSHMTSPVFKTLARLMPIIDVILGLIGKHEIDPSSEFFKKFTGIFCEDGSITNPVCTNVIFLICGYSEELLDKELLPAILAHTPAGSSTKQFTHFAQLVNSGHFRQFDHGWWGNFKKYSSFTPPSYKFENVKVPVALHYAVNDWLSHPKDVEKIYSKLPNPIGKFRVPHEKFNHLDFVWAKDVKTLLYNKVLSLLARYHHDY